MSASSYVNLRPFFARSVLFLAAALSTHCRHLEAPSPASPSDSQVKRISFLDRYFSERALRKTIERGAYGMIESTSRFYADKSRAVKHQRFSDLHRDLIESGIPHRQIVGSYEGHVTDLSFLVVKPDNMDEEIFLETLIAFGKKYLQQSVIYSASLSPGELHKRNYLVFTTGEHAGYSRSGTGFVEGREGSYSLVTTTEGAEIYIGTYMLAKEYVKHPGFEE